MEEARKGDSVSKKSQDATTINWQKRIISERKASFTKLLAEYYLSLEEFRDIEREVSDEHVASLVRAMETGQFMNAQAVISIAVCGWDKKERKLNGQHISWARSYVERANYKPFIKVVRYKVDTEDEYRLLYKNFDRNRVRTAAHLAKMALFDTPEYEGIRKSTIQYLCAGAKFWRFHQERIKSDVVHNALRYEFPDIGRTTGELLSYVISQQAYHLKRGPVIAAMMETIKAAKSKAVEFWNMIIEGLFQSKTDPPKLLADYLHRTVLGSRSNVGTRQQVSSEEMFNVCIGCWNAYRAGKRLTKTPPGKRAQRLVAR
jgi:hypothetical protein